MDRYILKTLGCKANLYDSQLLEKQLQDQGWLPQNQPWSQGQGLDPAPLLDTVKLCIINSCTVTDEADKQTRKLAKRLSKENPEAKIVVTGCAAEVNPESWVKSQGIHYVVGNQDKNNLIELVLSEFPQTSIASHILNQPNLPNKILGKVLNYKEIRSAHPMDREWPAATDSFFVPPTALKGRDETGKTRSFLKIQEGCNAFCTYCIIPYGRGPSRSLRPREVIEQVRELVSQGVQEIVITGTNIGDYGLDWSNEPALGDLLEMIFSETTLKRLRVSSLDPTEITPQIIALMEKEPRFCPHFHISLQSPHSRILKLMKRKYTYAEVESCLNRIAKIKSLAGPVFVGMDVITGFPGETEEEFEWGYTALSSLPWSRLHVFPYSEREGTPATRLPLSVHQSVRVQRGKKLNQLSLDRLTSHYRGVLEKCRSQQNCLGEVLMERKSEKGWVAGYTPNYLRILVNGDEKTVRNELVSFRPSDLMIDRQGKDVALIGTIERSVSH